MDKKIILALLATGLLLFALVSFVSAPSKNIEIKDKREEHISVVPGAVFCVERNLSSKGKAMATIAPLFSDGLTLESIGLKKTTTETYTVEVPDYGTCIRDVAMNFTTDTRIEQYSCITGYHQEERTRNTVTYEPITGGDYETDKEGRNSKENEVERHRGNLPEKLKGLRNVGHSNDFNPENNATIRMCFKAPEWDSGISSGQISYLAYDDSDYDYESTTWWDLSYDYRYRLSINLANSEKPSHMMQPVVLDVSQIKGNRGTLALVYNRSGAWEIVDFEWFHQRGDTANYAGQKIRFLANLTNNAVNDNFFIYSSDSTVPAKNKTLFTFYDGFELNNANGWSAGSITTTPAAGSYALNLPGATETTYTLTQSIDAANIYACAFLRTSATNVQNIFGFVDAVTSNQVRCGIFDGESIPSPQRFACYNNSAAIADVENPANTYATLCYKHINTMGSYTTFDTYVNNNLQWQKVEDLGTVTSLAKIYTGSPDNGNVQATIDEIYITNGYDFNIYKTQPTVTLGVEETKPSGEIAPQGSGLEAVIESNSSGNIVLSPASGGKVKFMSSLTDGANEVSIANIKSAYDHSLQDSIKSVVNWQQQCSSCVGADDVNANEVQRRVQNSCIGATAIHAIDADGTVTCVDVGSSGSSGSGDITEVWPVSGSGLTGGASSGAVSIGTDFNTIQKRVSGVCAIGNSIREILSDGTVTCEPDDVGSGGVADTNAATICAGTDTYLDGEGNCDDISTVYVKKSGDVMSGPLDVARVKISGKTALQTLDNFLLVNWENSFTNGLIILGNILHGGNIIPVNDNLFSLGSASFRWKEAYIGAQYIGDVREYYKENPNYNYEIGMVVAIDTDSGYEIKPLTDVTDRILGVVANLSHNVTEKQCSEGVCYNITYHLDTAVAIYGKFSPVKVKGTIQIGDYLVASDEPGVVTSMYEKEHPFNPSAFKKSKNKKEYNFNAKMFPTLGIAMENYNSTSVGTIKVVLGK